MSAPSSIIKEIFETMSYGPAPEAASTAEQWVQHHHQGRFLPFIDGQFREPISGEFFDTINPANGSVIGQIAQCNAEDVDAAVAAATTAFPAWASLSGHTRARYLYAIARLVQKHSRLLAVLETMDNGKPIRETRDIDIPLVARHFYHHAGWAQMMPTEMADYEPVGVVGQVIPWNFPLLMLAWKIAPALAMGNTVVLKPAEFTSLTAIAFAEICVAAGLPKGVVNIITGDGRTGAAIVNHPGIQKIAFTGSTDVGRIIRKAIAGSGKKLSLELGGKSPFIVFDDADIDSVVEGVVDAIWFNQGQVCCAGSRLLVQETVAEKLIAKLKARMETLRVGDPLDKAVDIGAIVAPVQLDRIKSLCQQGVDEGASCWQPSWSVPREGFFFPPTLFTNVAPAATIAQVEIFGPVLVSMTFRTPAEAVQLANNTRFGLAASIWTENINLALDLAPKIKAGTVWINCTNVFDAASGFGGYRESGFGREGGKEGLFEYVKPRIEREFFPLDETRATLTVPPTAETRPDPRAIIAPLPAETAPPTPNGADAAGIDRTAKMYVGGKQTRPDGGYSLPIITATGKLVGEVGAGNRKDIRDAVEAARKAESWARATAHNRAQIIYYIAENLSARADEFARRITTMTDESAQTAAREVEACIDRLYFYAAWTDKYDGQVHHTPLRNVTLAMPEPVGTLGIVCPPTPPLLGFISTVIPAIAMGNTVIVMPSEPFPLAATDFYQVLDTSDVPGGVVNIVTGRAAELADVLANHDDIDGIWYFGPNTQSAICAKIDAAAAENMKRTWLNHGKARDWFDPRHAQGAEFLRHATEIKNIWVPYGE